MLWKEALLWTDIPLTPAGGSPLLWLEVLYSLKLLVACPADNSRLISDPATWPGLYLFSHFIRNRLFSELVIGGNTGVVRGWDPRCTVSNTRAGELGTCPTHCLSSWEKSPLYTLPIVPSAGARWNFTA